MQSLIDTTKLPSPPLKRTHSDMEQGVINSEIYECSRKHVDFIHKALRLLPDLKLEEEEESLLLCEEEAFASEAKFNGSRKKNFTYSSTYQRYENNVLTHLIESMNELI